MTCTDTRWLSPLRVKDMLLHIITARYASVCVKSLPSANKQIKNLKDEAHMREIGGKTHNKINGLLPPNEEEVLNQWRVTDTDRAQTKRIIALKTEH